MVEPRPANTWLQGDRHKNAPSSTPCMPALCLRQASLVYGSLRKGKRLSTEQPALHLHRHAVRVALTPVERELKTYHGRHGGALGAVEGCAGTAPVHVAVKARSETHASPPFECPRRSASRPARSMSSTKRHCRRSRALSAGGTPRKQKQCVCSQRRWRVAFHVWLALSRRSPTRALGRRGPRASLSDQPTHQIARKAPSAQQRSPGAPTPRRPPSSNTAPGLPLASLRVTAAPPLSKCTRMHPSEGSEAWTGA